MDTPPAYDSSSSAGAAPPWLAPPSNMWNRPMPPWEDRIRFVQHLNAVSVPQPTAELHHPDSENPGANFPLLSEFQRVGQARQERLRRQSTGQVTRIRVESLGNDYVNATPYAPDAVPSQAHAQSVSEAATVAVENVAQVQASNASRAATARVERQRAAVRRLALMSQGAVAQPAPPAPVTPRARREQEVTCVICSDEYMEGDMLARLECEHTFHQQCIDLWAATQTESGRTPGCPCCRRPIRASEVIEYTRPAQRPTPHGTPDTHYSSAESTLPVWMVPSAEAEPVFHAATQLPAGRLSVIVDSGAWTNLIGANLARSLAKKAVENRHQPRQDKLSNPIQIQGVGNGVQACEWQMTCPVAVPTEDGAMLHEFSAPIVTGAGADLPGLLGLQSLQKHRAILDTHRQVLILPGQGDIEWKMPPGTVEIPLERAPSGHLVMVLDEYRRVVERRGGLPNPVRQFHSSDAVPAGAPLRAPAAPAAGEGGAPSAAPPLPEVSAPTPVH